MAENRRNRGGAVADAPEKSEETVTEITDTAEVTPDGTDTTPEITDSPGAGVVDPPVDVEEPEDDDEVEEGEEDEEDASDSSLTGGTVEGVVLVHGPDSQEAVLPQADRPDQAEKPPIPTITLGALSEASQKALKEMEDDSSIVPGDKSSLTELAKSVDEMVTDFGAEYTLDASAKSYVRRVTDAAIEVIARFYQHVYQTRLGRLAEMVSKEMNKTDEQGRIVNAAVAKMVAELFNMAELSRLRGLPDGRLIIATTAGGVIVTFVPDGLHSKRADQSTARRGVEGATTGRRGRLPAGEGPIEWTENGKIERISGSDALVRLYAKGSRAAKHVLENVEGWSSADIQAAVAGVKNLGSNPPKTKTNRLLYAKNAIRDETHPYARVLDDGGNGTS